MSLNPAHLAVELQTLLTLVQKDLDQSKPLFSAQASLAIANLPPNLVGEPLEDQRLFECVNCILSFQNADGGFATYELTRSYAWLEVSSLKSLKL